jgi:hypothetical protein
MICKLARSSQRNDGRRKVYTGNTFQELQQHHFRAACGKSGDNEQKAFHFERFFEEYISRKCFL